METFENMITADGIQYRLVDAKFNPANVEPNGDGGFDAHVSDYKKRINNVIGYGRLLDLFLIDSLRRFKTDEIDYGATIPSILQMESECYALLDKLTGEDREPTKDSISSKFKKAYGLIGIESPEELINISVNIIYEKLDGIEYGLLTDSEFKEFYNNNLSEMMRFYKNLEPVLAKVQAEEHISGYRELGEKISELANFDYISKERDRITEISNGIFENSALIAAINLLIGSEKTSDSLPAHFTDILNLVQESKELLLSIRNETNSHIHEDLKILYEERINPQLEQISLLAGSEQEVFGPDLINIGDILSIPQTNHANTWFDTSFW